MKVSDLKDEKLDYWVAKAEALVPYREEGHKRYWLVDLPNDPCLIIGPAPKKALAGLRYSPSTDWSQGGPIIQRELGDLIPYEDEKSAEGIWKANGVYKCQLKGMGFVGEGRTILIAAMRAFVASKFGAEVDDDKGI